MVEEDHLMVEQDVRITCFLALFKMAEDGITING